MRTITLILLLALVLLGAVVGVYYYVFGGHFVWNVATATIVVEILVMVITFLILGLVIVFLWTPAWSWLKARILGRTLLEVIHNDGRFKLFAPKYVAESNPVEGYGRFLPNRMGITTGYGVKKAIVLSDFAPYLAPEFLHSAMFLKDQGFENAREAEVTAELCNIYEGEGINLLDEDTEDAIKYLQDKGYSPAFIGHFLNYKTGIKRKGLMERMLGSDRSYFDHAIKEVKNNGYVYVNWQTIKDFNLKSAYPMGIEKTVDMEKVSLLKRMLEQRGTDIVKLVGIVITLSFVALIIYMILKNVNIGEVVSSTAQSVSGGGKVIGL